MHAREQICFPEEKSKKNSMKSPMPSESIRNENISEHHDSRTSNLMQGFGLAASLLSPPLSVSLTNSFSHTHTPVLNAKVVIKVSTSSRPINLYCPVESASPTWDSPHLHRYLHHSTATCLPPF